MISDADICIVICTRDRAQSLHTTLRSLVDADRRGVNLQVVVVDNGSQDNTPEVANSFSDDLPIQYLFEERRGKGAALNRALDSGSLGDVIAILDDDITLRQDWFQGVASICARWPTHDVFCGRLNLLWPEEPRASWTTRPEIQWVFSVLDCGQKDSSILDDLVPFPSGNCFWFRRRVLETGVRFPEIWLTEPGFVLRLADSGCLGMAGPDAVAFHRIQSSLITRQAVRARAILLGRSLPHVQLLYPSHSPRFRRSREQPLLFQTICLAKLLRWVLAYVLATLRPQRDVRIARQTVALLGISNNSETLRSFREIARRRELKPISRIDS